MLEINPSDPDRSLEAYPDVTPGNGPERRVVVPLVVVLLLGGCGFPYFILDGAGGGEAEPVEIPYEPLPEYPPGRIRVLGVASDTGVEDPRRAALLDARKSLRAILEGLRTRENRSFAEYLRTNPEQRKRFNRWLEELAPHRTETRQGMRIVELRVRKETLREQFGLRLPD